MYGILQQCLGVEAVTDKEILWHAKCHQTFLHRSLFEARGADGTEWLETEVVAAAVRQCPPSTSVAALWIAMKEADVVPLGDDSLTLSLMSGRGLVPGQITELFGEAAVGKTQLLLLTVLSTCAKGGVAIYIATEDIPATRLSQLAEHVARQHQRTATELLERLFLRRVKSAAEMTDLLTSGNFDEVARLNPLRLVVLDSIAAMQWDEGFSVQQGEAWRSLAARLRVVVLIANQVRFTDDNPALGLAWSHFVHTRLHLHRYQKASVRRLSIVFSPHLPQNQVSVIITEKGVELSV